MLVDSNEIFHVIRRILDLEVKCEKRLTNKSMNWQLCKHMCWKHERIQLYEWKNEEMLIQEKYFGNKLYYMWSTVIYMKTKSFTYITDIGIISHMLNGN